jgi:hypothetical protein
MTRVFVLAGLAATAAAQCLADPAEVERQTERALMERDRQAAEAADPQLRQMPLPNEALPYRPDERAFRAREREAFRLNKTPPSVAPPSAPPLPLPGGAGSTVNPIPVQRPPG